MSTFLFFLFINIGLSSPQLIYESDKVIWGIDFINQNEIIFTERSGKIKKINLNSKKVTVYSPPRFLAKGQGGLLDIKVKKYQNKAHLYLTYSLEDKGISTTALARSPLQQKLQWSILFKALVKEKSHIHYGSRIAFNDDQLFLSIGDRGNRVLAQSLQWHQGKILRLNLDGKAYKNNPFQSNGLNEIWSLGHRNPQGLFYNKKTQQLVEAEFGPQGGDEINLIERGLNYGWPKNTFGREYHGPKIGLTHSKGFEQPLQYWFPSISPSGIAIKGEYLYIACLSSQQILRLHIVNNKVISQRSLFTELNERFRHVAISPDKNLYASTDSGRIYKLSPQH